jgi:hypothetical protein
MALSLVAGATAPGAAAFAQLASKLCAQVVQLDSPEMLHAQRDARARQLRDSLRKTGPATAAELGVRTGIPSNRIGGILSHEIDAGRVIVWRDERATRHAHHPSLVYAYAQQSHRSLS